MSPERKYKIVVICGPTATGKSDFGVVLAKKFNGEIISADSRQVYKGMDLGTGKITKKEMRGVPHHLLDVVSPRAKAFNGAKFQRSALKKIREIERRRHLPFLVGGTGFWIETVAKNVSLPDVPPNPKLRAKLAKKSTEELFKELQKINHQRAKNIDRHNKVRLIRALEIAKSKTPKIKVKPCSAIEALEIGLDLPTDELYSLIEKRLDKRLKSGLIKEVEGLHKNGVSWKKLEEFGLEYRYIAYFLQGKLNKIEMREQLFIAIKHYAKRQRTWFKRNKNIIWLNPKNKSSLLSAETEIKNFIG